MTNIRRLLVLRLLVWRLLVWWFPVWWFLGLLAKVDCCGFSIGWFGGVGPVSFRLQGQLASGCARYCCRKFLAAVSGKRVLRRWVRRRQFGSCQIQAASGTPSGRLNPQVPNPMQGKPRVHPCHSRQTQQSTYSTS